MASHWTKEQKQVIDFQQGNLLVSAAAGSGKTAVLVERIISLITRADHPLNIDELLVVTFTKAAAAEMRERIFAAITAALEKDPENEHLQQSEVLLHSAAITTIDSFCMRVVREHFHVINIDPSFRTGDEAELSLLRMDVAADLIEEKYAEGNEDFLAFAESYAGGRSDDKLEEYIERLYLFSESYPWPDQWLSEQENMNTYENFSDGKECLWMQKLLEQLVLSTQSAGELCGKAINICRMAGGPVEYLLTLENDAELIESLRKSKTLEDWEHAMEHFSFPRLAGRPVKTVHTEQVKMLRDEYKKEIMGLRDSFFFQPLFDSYEDLRKTVKPMKVLLSLTREFRVRYAAAKEEKNLVDFSDLEHFALQILLKEENSTLVPQPAAESYRNQFSVIMIDEYQDSNLVQERILQAISREPIGTPNVFMVGDVKQSIYRFRLARPELFMEKHESFLPFEGGENDTQGNLHSQQGYKIDLCKNFRSRPEVLNSVNYVFEHCMRKEFGRISYDRKAALYPGRVFPEGQGYETELLLLRGKDERGNAKEGEASAIAREIKRLVGKLMITDKDRDQEIVRPCGYGDITILLRTMSGWAETYAHVLTAEGIPTFCDTQTGFFQTPEIKVVLDYLRILDNPFQDIAMTSVLRSPMVGCNNDELAQIRIFKRSFYEAVIEYLAGGREDDLSRKLRSFHEVFESLREMRHFLTTVELLRQMYQKTGFYDLVSVMPAGERRAGNLDLLLQQAMVYGETCYHGIFHFLRYVDRLLFYEVDYGESAPSQGGESAVRIMSIHRSKGLEFPVVFIGGMCKRFNSADEREPVLLHPEYGLGPMAIDGVLRTRVTTLPRQVLLACIRSESIAEELRLLYVAMTRAKEKLIMVGTIGKTTRKPESHLDFSGQTNEKMNYGSLCKAATYLDFVGSCMLTTAPAQKNPETGDVVFMQPGAQWERVVKPSSTNESVCFLLRVEEPFHAVHEDLIDAARVKLREKALRERMGETTDTGNSPIYDELEKRLYFCYPYEKECKLPIKVSVSELKHRAMQQAELIEPTQGETMSWTQAPKHRISDGKAVVSGGELGTLYHRILELIPLERVKTESELKNFLDEMIKQELVSEQELSLLNQNKLKAFLASSLAERMRHANRTGVLWKEQPFVIGVPPDGRDDSEDLLLVQGIIDVFFEEDGALVLCDYKTDAKDELSLVKCYRSQLEYYAKALEQVTGKVVKERIIYSFYMEKEIQL